MMRDKRKIRYVTYGEYSRLGARLKRLEGLLLEARVKKLERSIAALEEKSKGMVLDPEFIAKFTHLGPRPKTTAEVEREAEGLVMKFMSDEGPRKINEAFLEMLEAPTKRPNVAKAITGFVREQMDRPAIMDDQFKEQDTEETTEQTLKETGEDGE